MATYLEIAHHDRGADRYPPAREPLAQQADASRSADAAADGESARPADRPPALSLTTLLLSLALAGAGGWLILLPDEARLAEMPPAAPPPLFAGAPDSCPEADPGAIAPRAREMAEAARAKSERYPFAARDGIRAVELYAAAASCFAAAGHDRDAERVTRERAALMAAIDDDYRAGRLELERATQYGRTREALAHVRRLLAMLAHLDDPYVEWLSALERRLSAPPEENP